MADYRFNVCIFVAVSTPGQATQDKTSIQTQLDGCREWCKKGGHRIVAEIVVPGHSRTYYNLDELVCDCREYAQMLDLARTRKINLVLCPIFDRLWRTPVLEAQVTHFLKAYGVQSQSLQMPVPLLPPEQVTTDVDPGDLLRMISGYLGRVDTQTRLWRVVENHKKRVRERGLLYGGPRPFGYRRGPSRNAPVQVIPEEIQWYLKMVEWVEDGDSYFTIIDRLSAADVRGTRGGHFDASAIRRVLSNPFYAGGMRLGTWERDPLTKDAEEVGEEIFWDVAQHEPVITRARWEALQDLISTRADTRRRQISPHVNQQWALQGILRCGVCGYGMGCIAHINKRVIKEDYVYYLLRCNQLGIHEGIVASRCTNKSYSYKNTLAMVIEETKQLIHNPKAYALAKAHANKQIQVVTVEMLLLQAEAVDKRIERVTQAIAMGTGALEALVRALEELEHSKTYLTQQIEEMESRQRDWSEFERNALALQDTISQLDRGDEKLLRKIFSRLYKAIYISPAGMRYELFA